MTAWQIIRDYFEFSRTERYGLFVLFVLCLLILGGTTFFVKNKKSTSSTEFSPYAEQVQAFYENTNEREEVEVAEPTLFFFNPNMANAEDLQRLGIPRRVVKTILAYRRSGGSFKNANDFKKIYGLTPALFQKLKPWIQLPKSVVASSKMDSSAFEPKQVIEPELFPFDPNQASHEELRRLGLPNRVINTLLKYRAKGGTFRKADDLSVIYGLSTAQFEQLRLYIQIVAPETTKISPDSMRQAPKDNRPANPSIILDINTASAEDWQRLRGIGPAYSRRIVNFREKLGGFYAINQITETYGLPDSIFQQIQPFLKLETLPRQILLNNASVADLSAHPYLNKKQAAVIVNYRHQHGAFQRIDDLLKTHVVKEKDLNRLRPYLQL